MIAGLVLAALVAQPAHRSEVSVAAVTLQDGRRVARLGITGLLVDGVDQVVAETVAAATTARVDILEIFIDSPGGSAEVGANVFATLSAANALVRCLVTGSASSMAFILLQACDDRAALPGAKLVIHRPYDLFTIGRRIHSEELRALADELDVTQAFMVEAMAARGDLPAAVYHERLSHGDWRMSTGEAIINRFLDRVVEDRADFIRSVEGQTKHKENSRGISAH
jgi:ATP-dependent protease ClpP protease subunit